MFVIFPVDEDGVIMGVGEMVDEYKGNGYDAERVRRVAYALSQERASDGVVGCSADRNWEDAERLVAIEKQRESLRP